MLISRFHPEYRFFLTDFQNFSPEHALGENPDNILRQFYYLADSRQCPALVEVVRFRIFHRRIDLIIQKNHLIVLHGFLDRAHRFTP